MSALREHQHEIAALARHQDVLLSAPHRIGKTFVAAHVVRECLQTTTAPGAIALAVAATPRERAELHNELARACGVPVLLCSDSDAVSSDTNASPPTPHPPTTPAIATRWESDMDWTKQQLAACIARHGQVVAVVSPTTLLSMLRKRAVPIDTVVAIVIEDTEQIHLDAPSCFRTVCEHLSAQPETERPRLFATTRARASTLDLSPTSRNALYARIRVLSLVPALDAAQLTATAQHFPPLLCELFDAATPGALTPPAPFVLMVDMRTFLYGTNTKHIDFIRIFRLELQLGNSAAVYDEKKRQDKINRFVADAASVYEHLGYWCLLKFIELELQANLQACLVDDPQNVNNRKKHQQQDAAGYKNDADRLDDREAEEGELVESESDNDADDAMDVDDETDAAPPSPHLTTEAAALLACDPQLHQRVQPILDVLTWLHRQCTNKVPLDATTTSPRLLKMAQLVRSRLLVAGATKRVWVFLERRSHCRVVTDFLALYHADLGLPPSCCMLGTSHARVAGSLHFSSNVKIMTLFNRRETNVLVTTSIAHTSQKARVEPLLCDLVIVMDELLESDKLFAFAKRADPMTGVVKYVTPNTPNDLKKFYALVHKMHEHVQLEAAHWNQQQAIEASSNCANRDNGEDAIASDVAALLRDDRRDLHGRLYVKPRVAPSPANPLEVVYRDTGAILHVQNAVVVLSALCDSLPGLDTYDKRPQYVVKRHAVPSTMSAATKQMRKKRLKHNAKIHDAIDACRADAEAKLLLVGTDEVVVDTRFTFTATLKLPGAFTIKKSFVSPPSVATADDAKGFVAFHACKELIKRGFLDRHFRSTLVDDLASTIHGGGETSNTNTNTNTKTTDPEFLDDTVIVDVDDADNNVGRNKATGKLKDLSTQNTYDLPPVSAHELSLRPIRTLLNPTASTADDAVSDDATVSMCCYGLTGVNYAILTTNELYTGNTNTGWRYDFATTDVMTPTIRPVTLAKTPMRVELSRAQLQQALHFHLIIMRLASMDVETAMRDVDIASGDVWKEFSEQNDKGYLVVPSIVDDPTASGSFAIDWSYVYDILGKPLIQPIWPFPDATEYPQDEWIVVPTARRNVTYVVQGLSATRITDLKTAFADKEAWKQHIKAAKSTTGNPILGRWHSSEQLLQADEDQPLIYGIQVPTIAPIIRRVMQRNNPEGSIAIASSKFNERLLIPECTSLLRLTKTRFFDAIGIVPVLYEFERKCQMSHLMGHIGLELDLKLLDDATSKPAYERLEILGDTFLKVETTWFMYQQRSDITQEGELTRLRRDIIRNDRLIQFARAAKLHHYMLYPAQLEQKPFEFWMPSCMGMTPKAIEATGKWIADVLEAICGAYLLGHGEIGARYFLRWVGVSVLDAPFTFDRPFYPDCFPCELYDDDVDRATASSNGSVDPRALDFAIARFDDLPQRLVWLQQRLKYTFQNKRLLLEAVTHSSAGHLELLTPATTATTNRTSSSDGLTKEYWRGDYERLEYLGDALIEYLTLSYAYLRYDTWLPGSLTQWKSATVSNDALGKTALACFGVDECICAGAVRIDRETLSVIARIERTYARTATASTNRSNSTNGTTADDDATMTHEIRTSFHALPATTTKQKKLKPVKLTGANPIALPKMFADVFEALVAAVFLDSGCNLQTTRDVFLGPLLRTIGKDAVAYVCRESGLTIDHFDDDPDAIMQSLLSDSEGDDDEELL